jgi:MFS transporter, PPP family, 3-phenylpropionic acid transporter
MEAGEGLPKAIYFFIFAAIASLFPFLVIHYQDLGLSGTQIGVLAALNPLVTVLTVPLWGALADATQRYKQLLLFMMAGCLVAVFLLSQVTQFVWLLVVIALFAFFAGSVMPLIDSSVLAKLEHKDRYGKLRLWGTIGFGLASPFVGYVTERVGLEWAFYFYLFFFAITTALVVFFPISRAPIRKPLGTGLLEFKNKTWLMFLLTIFVGGFGLAVAGNYYLLHMKNLGGTQTFVGLSLTFATLGELPFMLFGYKLLKRYPAKTLLVLALFFIALRLVAYSLAQAPWHFLFIQILHGPTFALIWIAGISYADTLSPSHLKATGQSLFAAMLSGVGGSLGGFVGGLLYDAVGAVQTFRLAAVMLVFATGVLMVINRSGQNVLKNTADETREVVHES